jgi:hypothetical protein
MLNSVSDVVFLAVACEYSLCVTFVHHIAVVPRTAKALTTQSCATSPTWGLLAHYPAFAQAAPNGCMSQ